MPDQHGGVPRFHRDPAGHLARLPFGFQRGPPARAPGGGVEGEARQTQGVGGRRAAGLHRHGQRQRRQGHRAGDQAIGDWPRRHPAQEGREIDEALGLHPHGESAILRAHVAGDRDICAAKTGDREGFEMQARRVLRELHADATRIDQALAEPCDPDGPGLQRKGQLRLRQGRAKAGEIGNAIEIKGVRGQIGEEARGLVADRSRESGGSGEHRAVRLQAQATRGEARP